MRPQNGSGGWLDDRARSMGRALAGIGHGLGTEPHLRLHLVATLGVVLLGWGCALGATDWALVALACGAVWSAELFNTALERLADALHPGQHPLVGRAKDVAAGAVLLTVGMALAVAAAVFGPPLARAFAAAL